MKLVWDKLSERKYETGVSHGVLFPIDLTTGNHKKGVAWNGLINVTESPSGAEPQAMYANNKKYLNLLSVEELGLSIEAYTYPEEFEECDGLASIAKGVSANQQKRTPFGLVYRSIVGNDIEQNDYGYKIHIVYNALAAPTEKSFGTINETPEAITFNWEVSTTPVDVPGLKPAASFVIESDKCTKEQLEEFETLLYGDDDTEPRLPTVEEIINIFADVVVEPPVEG